MSVSYYWRLKCSTEGVYKYVTNVDDSSTSTECPANAGHSITDVVRFKGTHTTTRSLLDVSWSTDTNPSLHRRTTNYIVLARARWRGSEALGNPSKIYIGASCDDGTMYIKITRDSDGATVAENTGVVSKSIVSIDMGTLNNITETDDVWSIHIKNTSGTADNYLAYLSVED